MRESNGGLIIRNDLYRQVVGGVLVEFFGRRDGQNTAENGEDTLYVGIPLSDYQIERLLDSIHKEDQANSNFPWKSRKIVLTHVCCYGVHVALPINKAGHAIWDTYQIYLEKHVKKILSEASRYCCHCHC